VELAWHAITSKVLTKTYDYLQLSPDQKLFGKKPQKLDPPPIFSFVENNPLIRGIRYWIKGGIWEDLKEYLKTWGIDWSWCDSASWQIAQHVASLALFTHWINKTMFANMCAGVLTKNGEFGKDKDNLISLLEQFEQLKISFAKAKGKELEAISRQLNDVKQELQTMIFDSRKMSFLPWLGFKNVKCAQWQAIFSFMTTIPMWTKFVKEAYKTIKALKNSDKSKTEKTKNTSEVAIESHDGV